MKRILSTALLALAALGAARAQSAQEVMAKVRDRSGLSTTQARVAMKLVDKAGAVSERLLDEFSVEKAGLAKTVIVFQKPANVKDTRFLSVENASGPEDRWIWLPAAGKIRRIASSEGGTSFMGTDLSYDDLSSTSRALDADTFVMLSTETEKGETVYVIEATPRDQAGTSWSKAVYRILAEKWLPLKIEQYDKKGALLKVNETLAYEKVDGYWTPMRFKVTNVQTGHSTELSMEILKFNKEIPAGVFTTRFLETGRP